MEILSNKKLQYQYLAVMFTMILIIFGYIEYESYLIKTNGKEIMCEVYERDVDYKGNVTIICYFFVDGVKYRGSDVITVIEKSRKFKVNEGDSVIVRYVKDNPTINTIYFISVSRHEQILE